MSRFLSRLINSFIMGSFCFLSFNLLNSECRAQDGEGRQEIGRQFHIGDILTLIHGRILTSNSILQVHELVDFVMGANLDHSKFDLVQTSQNMIWLKDQFQQLKKIDVSGINEENFDQRLNKIAAEHGEMHIVLSNREYLEFPSRYRAVEFIPGEGFRTTRNELIAYVDGANMGSQVVVEYHPDKNNKSKVQFIGGVVIQVLPVGFDVLDSSGKIHHINVNQSEVTEILMRPGPLSLIGSGNGYNLEGLSNSELTWKVRNLVLIQVSSLQHGIKDQVILGKSMELKVVGDRSVYILTSLDGKTHIIDPMAFGIEGRRAGQFAELNFQVFEDTMEARKILNQSAKSGEVRVLARNIGKLVSSRKLFPGFENLILLRPGQVDSALKKVKSLQIPAPLTMVDLEWKAWDQPKDLTAAEQFRLVAEMCKGMENPPSEESFQDLLRSIMKNEEIRRHRGKKPGQKGPGKGRGPKR